MLAYRLFFDRLAKYWRFQTRVFFSVVDWVVALYIVIPGLLIAGYHYIQLGQGSYTWPAQLTYFALLLILFIWTWLGRFHLFVEEADQLLVRQHQRVFRGIQHLGILYSSIYALFGTLFVFFLLWPLMIVYMELSYAGVFSLLCLTLGAKLLHHAGKLYHFLPFKRGIKWLLTIFIFMIDAGAFFSFGFLIGDWSVQSVQSTVYTGFGSLDNMISDVLSLGLLQANKSISLILVLIVIFLVYYISTMLLARKRTRLSWSFPFDCARELEDKYRTVDMLLNQSMRIGAPSFRVKKRRRSRSTGWQLILPSRKLENRHKPGQPQGLVPSLFYRFIVRNKERMLGLVRLTSVFIMAVTLTPLPFKWGMWLVGIGVLLFHQRDLWRQWVQHEYIQLFNWNDTLKKKEAVRGIFVSTSPSVALISLNFGIVVYGVPVGLLCIMGGLLLSFALAWLMDVQLVRVQSH